MPSDSLSGQLWAPPQLRALTLRLHAVPQDCSSSRSPLLRFSGEEHVPEALTPVPRTHPASIRWVTCAPTNQSLWPGGSGVLTGSDPGFRSWNLTIWTRDRARREWLTQGTKKERMQAEQDGHTPTQKSGNLWLDTGLEQEVSRWALQVRTTEAWLERLLIENSRWHEEMAMSQCVPTWCHFAALTEKAARAATDWYKHSTHVVEWASDVATKGNLNFAFTSRHGTPSLYFYPLWALPLLALSECFSGPPLFATWLWITCFAFHHHVPLLPFKSKANAHPSPAAVEAAFNQLYAGPLAEDISNVKRILMYLSENS